VRAAELLDRLRGIAALPESARDQAVDDLLGLGAASPACSAPPGEHLVGHHASGVDAILRMLREAPVGEGDVFVDLGSGLGRVVLLASLLTGARARGVEIQPELARRSRAAVERLREAGALRAELEIVTADARDAELDDGTVFYLYTPFTGPVLAAVLARLRAVAERRAPARIVVCALGFDLERAAPWLVPRPTDAFWLTIYDSDLARG
jgi:SAM-dependent methyltransferase